MAILRHERGIERVAALARGALVSSVNVAEVHTKLVGGGQSDWAAWADIQRLGCESVPFDDELARATGALVTITRPFGLSLEDRACLALAMQRNAVVYTADRAWKSLPLEVQIELIR